MTGSFAEELRARLTEVFVTTFHPSTMPGLTADNPLVVSADLAAKPGPDGLAAIRSAHPFVKIET